MKLKIMILVVLISMILVISLGFKINDEINIIEDNDDYTLKISYPVLNNKKDKEIKEIINKYKNNFLNEIKNKGQFKYDLNVSYTLTNYKDITFIHFVIFSFIGGNHYERYDEAIVYDDKDITLNDLFENNYFDYLSSKSYQYIINYLNETNTVYDINLVKEGTNEPDDFKYFTLNEQGLSLLFPPYQVASWAVNEINITIPYKDINNLLKEKYRNYDVITNEKTVFNEITKRDLSKFKNKKLIALTFDDGPSRRTTKKLLKGLKERDSKATFFILGNRIKNNKDIIKEAYFDGNQIGSHTYSHKNLTNLNEDKIKEEVNKTITELEEIGIKTNLLRPPYGNVNNNIKKIINANIILWDIDPLDWKYKNADKISKRIVKKAYDGAIILLHDIYMSSVNGSLKAIDILKEQGYEFVTIEEMCELKNITLDPMKTYFNF